MLDLVLWSNSRGVFHRDLACDNFIVRGDTVDDIKSQGAQPSVGLIDFGAAIVSTAACESECPDSFVAGVKDQWHEVATHGLTRSTTDPYAVSRVGQLSIVRAQF